MTAREYRALKVVYRKTFEHDRPYEREFQGIKKYEPVSRQHDSQVHILHVGRNDAAGYFYYVMDLADDANDTVAGARIRRLEPSPARRSRSTAAPAFRRAHGASPRRRRCAEVRWRTPRA